MENFETLVEAMEAWRQEGYTEYLSLKKGHLVAGGEILKLREDEFTIDKFYRFEGMTNPSDQSILYAISSDKHNIKGLLVHAYGVYAEEIDQSLIEKLAV